MQKNANACEQMPKKHMESMPKNPCNAIVLPLIVLGQKQHGSGVWSPLLLLPLHTGWQR
jgi:hypothetical protein